jgi:hypothetical protein
VEFLGIGPADISPQPLNTCIFALHNLISAASLAVLQFMRNFGDNVEFKSIRCTLLSSEKPFANSN